MINLYTTQDAEAEMKAGKVTGLEASITKWQVIVESLKEIRNEAASPCGLCHSVREKNWWFHCSRCVLGKNARDGVCCCLEWERVYNVLISTIIKSEKMLERLYTEGKRQGLVFDSPDDEIEKGVG